MTPETLLETPPEAVGDLPPAPAGKLCGAVSSPECGTAATRKPDRGHPSQGLTVNIHSDMLCRQQGPSMVG